MGIKDLDLNEAITIIYDMNGYEPVLLDVSCAKDFDESGLIEFFKQE